MTMHEPPETTVPMKCLVCALVKPWGLLDLRTGVAVCVDCKNAPAALAALAARCPEAIKKAVYDVGQAGVAWGEDDEGGHVGAELEYAIHRAEEHCLTLIAANRQRVREEALKEAERACSLRAVLNQVEANEPGLQEPVLTIRLCRVDEAEMCAEAIRALAAGTEGA